MRSKGPQESAKRYAYYVPSAEYPNPQTIADANRAKAARAKMLSHGRPPIPNQDASGLATETKDGNLSRDKGPIARFIDDLHEVLRTITESKQIDRAINGAWQGSPAWVVPSFSNRRLTKFERELAQSLLKSDLSVAELQVALQFGYIQWGFLTRDQLAQQRSMNETLDPECVKSVLETVITFSEGQYQSGPSLSRDSLG